MSGTVVKYFGRKTDFRGKSLWEIVSDLKDYGVGRLVVRNMFQRYPEPCYMRILKVQTVDATPSDLKYTDRKVKVTVERTWRGVTMPKPVEIYSTSYKADYELVEKEDEPKYLQNSARVTEKLLAPQVEFPPLLREFITQETGQTNPTMKVHYRKTDNKFVRLAKEGEKPDIQMTMSLGAPSEIGKKLYEGLL